MAYSDFIHFCWHCREKPTDGNSAVMHFGRGQAVSLCGSCTLAVLVGCGLLSFLFVYLSFLFLPRLWFPISLTVASLQGVAQDLMLSCNHCLTLSLFSVIFMSLKSPAASAALQPPLPLPLTPPPPVSLSRGSASLLFIFSVLLSFLFFYFWGDPLRSPSVRWLAFLFSYQTPHPPLCPPCALPWFSAAPVYSSVIGQWVSVLFVCSCVS